VGATPLAVLQRSCETFVTAVGSLEVATYTRFENGFDAEGGELQRKPVNQQLDVMLAFIHR
jgi:hypothetical protein